MDPFGEGSSWERLYVHIRPMHVFSCSSARFLRSRQDGCSEGERTLRGSDVRFCAEARWQIAGAGRWKHEKTTDLLYSTLLWETDGSPLFHVLRFSPPCPWAGDASGSGLVERWEDQRGRRPLTRAETHDEVREGFGKRRREWWQKISKKKKKKTSERWVCCRGLQYSSNSHGNAMMM